MWNTPSLHLVPGYKKIMSYPLNSCVPCVPSQPRRMSLLLVWWNTGPVKTKHHLWCLLKKKQRNLSELDSENEAAYFLRFFVIESLGEVCLA